MKVSEPIIPHISKHCRGKNNLILKNVTFVHGWRSPIEINFDPIAGGFRVGGHKYHNHIHDRYYALSTVDWRTFSNNINIFQVQRKIWNEPCLLHRLMVQISTNTDILVGHSMGAQVVLRLLEIVIKKNLVLPKHVVLLDPAFVKPMLLDDDTCYKRCIGIIHTLKYFGTKVVLVKSSQLPEILGTLLYTYDQLWPVVSEYHDLKNNNSLIHIKASHHYAITYFFKTLMSAYLSHEIQLSN